MSLARPYWLLLLVLTVSLFLAGCGSSSGGLIKISDGPPTISFTASPTSISEGEFTTLTWNVLNATSISVSPNLNESDDGSALPRSGSRTLVLQTTTVYTMTAQGPRGTATKEVRVEVGAANQSLTLEADPTTTLPGGGSTLRWSSTGITQLSIDNGVGTVTPGTGSVRVTPTQTTTYKATGTGPRGTQTASATVTVAGSNELAISLTANKTTLAPGEKVTLTWVSQNANSVKLEPQPGAVGLSGSVELAPTATTTYVATATGVNGNTSTSSVTVNVLSSSAGMENIKHVIFFMQENRSFDNYFGVLGPYRQAKGLPAEIDGLDLTRALKTVSGRTVYPFHQRTVETDVMSPSWNESHFYVNRQANGEFAMDNWMMQQRCSIYVDTDPECTRTMGYYDQRDIPYYYELATQFATSDRFFSSAMSGTLVNRAFLFSATSGGMNNPEDPFPVSAPTIFRKLSEAGISWLYFYQDDSVFLGYYTCGGACDWDRYMDRVFPISKYYEILASPTANEDLPQVVFIQHAAKLRLDEHTGNNIQEGVALSKKLIDALMNSKAWPYSVFFLTHDEGGGLYDHVPPYPVVNPDGKAPILETGDIGEWDNFTYSGFRVPLMVVSPWVKPNYVSHTNREFTSILKFIQTRFGLTPLTQRDAQADDMMEFFDFTSPRLLVPPPLPEQPTNGTVDRSLQAYP
ncbi:MAG TPA: alkaline phosphatase family protein [Terriglobales bacterium]|nr:alkaline phosphatase family protein [Terriglobales bacterium]